MDISKLNETELIELLKKIKEEKAKREAEHQKKLEEERKIIEEKINKVKEMFAGVKTRIVIVFENGNVNVHYGRRNGGNRNSELTKAGKDILSKNPSLTGKQLADELTKLGFAPTQGQISGLLWRYGANGRRKSK